MPDRPHPAWSAPDWVVPPVIVGCSGGADSLALLLFAARAGLDPVAVHVDHGLRPDSASEGEFVVGVAEGLGCRSRKVRVHVSPGPGLEARARRARYEALETARLDAGASAVLVGHTADDQAETVLINLLRGAATTGLGGMPPVRDRIVRPLLGLRRSDTVEACARAALAPIADPMNADLAFRRVWVRRELIPWLEAVADRDIGAVLSRQAALLRDESDYLDAEAEQRLSEAGAAANSEALPLAALDAPPALARRVVRRWLGPPPPSADDVETVLRCAAPGGPTGIELAGGRRVERSRDALHVVAPEAVLRLERPVTVSVPGTASAGSYRLDTWVERAAPIAWPDGRDVCVFDADRIGASLVVRPSEPGDRLSIPGLDGAKRVVDVLAEAGVPAGRRPSAPVICDSRGTPLWVLGYRVGASARVSAATRRYLWVSAHHEQQPGPTPPEDHRS